MKSCLNARCAPTKASPNARGLAVVDSVLHATIEELARVGYGALSIEDVAQRACVNKTTVYRRWPTKAELVRAALFSTKEQHLHDLNTGSLRGDLIGMAIGSAKFMQSSKGRMLLKMIFTGDNEPELIAIAKSLRDDHASVPRRVIRRAIERGEINPRWSGTVLAETLFGTLTHRIQKRETVTRRFIEEVVDLILMGAKA